jgi:hypothetical protein
VKFGRVPFRVKENSLQMIEGQEWQDSMMLGLDGFHGPHMQSLEKNITDIDSADLERDMKVDVEEGGGDANAIDMSILNESQKIALQKIQTDLKDENGEMILADPFLEGSMIAEN